MRHLIVLGRRRLRSPELLERGPPCNDRPVRLPVRSGVAQFHVTAWPTRACSESGHKRGPITGSRSAIRLGSSTIYIRGVEGRPRAAPSLHPHPLLKHRSGGVFSWWA